MPAQTLTVSIYDNTGATPDQPLPASYQFPATPQGGSASTLLKVKNTGSSPAQVSLIYVGASAGSPTATPDFTVIGVGPGEILAPSGSQVFTLNFTPSAQGQLVGYLQIAYVTQGGTCSLASGSASAQCSVNFAAVSTLEGTGTAPQWLLTYNRGAGGSSPLQPSLISSLDFGDTATSASSSITFTLTNQTSSPIAAPSVALQNAIFLSSAFSLDTSNLPATIPANGAVSFTVTFAPGQTGLTKSTLLVGNNSYGIEGTGIAVSDTDALQIAYVDATGVRTLPQAATPISFGQLVPGTAGGATLKFTVTNPSTSFSPVTLSALSVTGAAYSLIGAPILPAVIQPNSSITFSITFSAGASGTFTGVLAIGSRQLALTGLSVVSPVPAMSLQVREQPLTSAQQVNLTVQASTAATEDAIGQLELAFTPAVTNVTDDAAVVFLVTGGRQLQVNLAAGSRDATYNGQSALTFQTGTTAGTITFTLTFPNTPPITKSYTITPAQIHVSGGQAVRQNPNMVITLDGYDNTYSAGQLSFVFYDSSGAQINATPMAVDATSNFHQYFFTNDPAGGTFAMQASFPVTGDVAKIGSVGVTLTNSAGQTTTKFSFQ
ncbi:MAG: choice-of-anchor D domain-containing protein [Acidobacteriota bacterium]|nr:choice-of-anchor D domain-containing protein [Acidobacteriota bacterium]